MEFSTDIFSQFDKKWALLTAGRPGDFIPGRHGHSVG